MDFKEEVVVNLEDTIEQKPSMKKRIVVASLLALAAAGTHWLPGRTIVPLQDSTSKTIAMAVADKQVPSQAPSQVSGPNSLLGDAVTDKTSQAVATVADVSRYHLDSDSIVDQAGLSRLLNGIAPLSGQAGLTSTDSIGQVNAVPEPRTAGLLLLAAAPILVRRKARTA